MVESKKETKKVRKCESHSFIVTASMLTGGRDNATQVRCSHCLLSVDLEKIESKEWQEANGI